MIDLTGQRFGKLTVIERAGSDKYGNAMWLCKCDCGNEVIVLGHSLKSDRTKSCGCLRREVTAKTNAKTKVTHGGRRTRLYKVWRSMRDRCNNPNSKPYMNYGGRGIQICPEWDSFEVFRNWALGTGYDERAKFGECTLDRIDTNGNYCPENCRWANEKEQQNNKRNNRRITIDGITKTVSEWSPEYGISACTVYHRLNTGWDPKQALTTPPGGANDE